MIVFIIIAAYLVAGMVVGRWTALRRMRQGLWGYSVWGGNGNNNPGEDDYIACALATAFWPLAAPLYFVTRPPKDKKSEALQKRIKELEKELL